MLFRSLTTAAILTLGITTAQAETLASTNVAFGDLNLAHPEDAKILAGRLQAAAKSVCLTANPDIKSEEMQPCIDDAIDMAMARIEGKLDRTVRAHLVAVRASLENP